MNRARDELLAGPGLTLNQHRGVGRRDGLHLLENALQRRALPDDLLEVILGADFVFEVELLAPQLLGHHFLLSHIHASADETCDDTVFAHGSTNLTYKAKLTVRSDDAVLDVIALTF